MLVRLAVRTRPAPEISALPACLHVRLCLSGLLLLAPSLERGSLAGWVGQPHMLMLAHSSSLSESIVLCGFLVVYVAMPAPRPSSQAADLRSDAFERPPPLSAPDAGLLGGLRRGVPSERESSTGSWSSSGCVGSNMRRSTFRIHVSAFRLSLTCRMSRCVAPRPTRSPLEWVCNDALVSGLD